MGLRDRERDPELPALAGEAHLRPPSIDELVALVGAHLQRPGTPAITGATWDYARWKRGVSITSVYTVFFEDGASEAVVAKRYVDGKDRTLVFRPRNEEHLAEICVRLAPQALLPERALALWVPPADRVLRGLPVFLDKKKLGNLVTRSGIAPVGAVKKRKARFTLLRYKPERRAVYRVDLELRNSEPKHRTLSGRVLPPAEAGRVIAARAALAEAGGGELVLPVAATNLRQGFLLEPWLEITGFAPDSFEHAREAGAQLARLHALTPNASVRRVAAGLPGDLDALFAVERALARAARAKPHPTPVTSVFCHGDFHPDQLVRRTDGACLLMDLDLLGAGDPSFDLACWIADWVIEHGRADLQAAADPLLEGYRSGGGHAPEPRRLAAFVAAELVCRAGSTLRRLEQGAIEKARFALAAAQAIEGQPG